MLRAGFARTDITPPPDCTLMGYEFRSTDVPPGNAGVHDPLLARVLVLDDGSAPAAVVSLDTCIVSTALARHLRRCVAEKIVTTPQRVIVSCTHTHSGPDLQEPSEAFQAGAQLPEAGCWDAQKPGQRYAALLPGSISAAAARAAGLTYPVRIGAGEAALGMGYNRRVRTPQGVRHCWNPQEQADLDPSPAPDPTCTVAVLQQDGGPRKVVLWSVGVHPVTLGKTSAVVSADYPGLACRLIEDFIPGSRAMFLLGAAGDTHPWIATQERTEHLLPVARTAASFVALLTHAVRPAGPAGLAAVGRTCRFGDQEVDLAVWRVGQVWLAAAPAEVFGELGAALRRRIAEPLLLATCSNGWTGYWPTEEAFALGVYEVDSARRAGRAPGDSEKLIDELVDMADELRRTAGHAEPAE